jgi:medium-chain acyl-[acyl-carrier-protein] hydrolase
MGTYNGTPAAILENQELLDILLPTIRADFSMAEQYNRLPITLQLHCPILALGSKQDEWLDQDSIAGWENVSKGSFETHWFEGDHFYLNQYTETLVDHISKKIFNLY